LLASLLTLAAVLFAASALQNYIANRDTSRRLFDDSLQESAGLLLQLAQHEIAEHGQILGIALLKAETQPGPYGFKFQIWTSDMQAGYRSVELPTTPLLPFNADGFGWTEISGQQWRAYATWNTGRTLQVQIAQSQKERQLLDRQALIRALANVVLLSAIAAGLIHWILSRSLRPLRLTAQTVSARSENDLRAVDDRDAPAEVRPLVIALNNLLARVRNTLQLERRFTADAAHELRTPLAAIRANAQVVVRARDAAEREVASRDLIASVDRSTRLVEQLLGLARADAALLPENTREVDLAELAMEQIIEQTPRAGKLGVILSSALESVQLRCDPALLAVLLRNLVDNALCHVPRGGMVTVVVSANPEGAVLEVHDTGIGIEPGERERVFERFYRAAGQKTTGSGLGLSIVRRIAELHGATVTLLDGVGGRGLRVRVRFPAAH
jgi:signal transduction histidine kinase